MNVSTINLTNEYTSLSPTNPNQSNLNNSSLFMKNNELQKRIYRKNNLFSSPIAQDESIVSGVGCQTAKNRGNTNKSFNLKIKLKKEPSSNQLKLST